MRHICSTTDPTAAATALAPAPRPGRPLRLPRPGGVLTGLGNASASALSRMAPREERAQVTAEYAVGTVIATMLVALIISIVEGIFHPYIPPRFIYDLIAWLLRLLQSI